MWKEPSHSVCSKATETPVTQEGITSLEQNLWCAFHCFLPCYYYPVKHSWQCKQVINRQVLEETGAGAGWVHRASNLASTPPSSESVPGTTQEHCPFIHKGCGPFGWRCLSKERKEASWEWEPPLFSNNKMNLAWEIRLRTKSGKTSDRVLVARDNMGYIKLQMTENQSAKGLPCVVWGQLISPSHNTGFNKSLALGNGLFLCLILQIINIFFLFFKLK